MQTSSEGGDPGEGMASEKDSEISIIWFCACPSTEGGRMLGGGGECNCVCSSWTSLLGVISGVDPAGSGRIGIILPDPDLDLDLNLFLSIVKTNYSILFFSKKNLTSCPKYWTLPWYDTY
jgi:hypothetical protein